MNATTISNNQDPVAVIESLLAQERADFEEHRNNASTATEPKLKSVYSRLADIHSALYAELRTILDDIKSRRVITEQINDLYK